MMSLGSTWLGGNYMGTAFSHSVLGDFTKCSQQGVEAAISRGYFTVIICSVIWLLPMRK